MEKLSIDKEGYIRDEDGHLIANVFDYCDKVAREWALKHGKNIVRAVNTHEVLIAAIKGILDVSRHGRLPLSNVRALVKALALAEGAV